MFPELLLKDDGIPTCLLYTHVTIFQPSFPQNALQLKNKGASSWPISMSGTKGKSSGEPDGGAGEFWHCPIPWKTNVWSIPHLLQALDLGLLLSDRYNTVEILFPLCRMQ